MIWRLREREERLIIKSIEDILNQKVVQEDIKQDKTRYIIEHIYIISENDAGDFPLVPFLSFSLLLTYI